MMRVVFLYVAQGDATLFFIPSNGSHLTMLIDSNQGRKHGGINLVALLKDLFEDGGGLTYFVNTHPHLDHAGGLDEIAEGIEIDNVWHSGHDPGKDHCEAYDALQRLRKKVWYKGGEDRILTGTRATERLGDAVYNVLSPAQHVQDEIADEDAETRYRRIHEHCAVLRIGYGTPAPSFVLITGDSDKCAWKEHITEYHGAVDENRIRSQILSASHHGSRTFFKENEEDPEPYTKHMDLIKPEYLVISAPLQEESCHGHPHDDALELYKKYVSDEATFHTGDGRRSFICDISSDGSFFINDDGGKLAETYGFPPDDEDGGGGKANTSKSTGPYVISQVDRKPMG
jgi:beta-lactamase superfamily II metal-dependent hydrolase